MMHPKYKDFLTKTLPLSLRTLSETQQPNFGVMSAHHMVEHLIYVTKSMMKRVGEPPEEPTKSHRYFRKFVDAGCPFEHRPKEDAKLSDIRTASIEDAIQLLESANEKFYSLFDSNPEFKSFNPLAGEFNLEELELFNYQHGRWHSFQFGLIEEFAAVRG